jgi:type IV pilus assembly protein PilW
MNMTSPKKTDGFTLVELMITLVLSLMITYAIAQVLISSNRSSVSSDGMSQSQETGRFVMSYLANNIRQAGLDSIPDRKISTPVFIDCATFPGLAADRCIAESNTDNTPTIADTELTIHSIGSHGDRLAVAWVPPLPLDAAGNDNPDPVVFGTDIRDCTGRGGYVFGDTILNVFWVQSDPNNPNPLPNPPDPDNPSMNNLVCQAYTFNGGVATNPSAVNAIANGIESMQILYGESLNPLPTDKDRNVNQYVTGDSVIDWNRVYAVRIAILTRSLIATTAQFATRNYVLLDAQPYVMNDAVNRQVFTTTFVINNYVQ